MGRKKIKRKRKCPTQTPQSSPTDNPPELELLNQWHSRMPQWLKEAEAAFDLDNRKLAGEILSESRVNKEIANLSGSEKIFVLYGIARMLMKFGREKDAEIIYRELDKISSYPVVKFEMGGICKRAGRISESLKYLEKAKELRPQSPVIWGGIGTCLIWMGQKEKGMDLVRKAAERMPDSLVAHSNKLFHMHQMSEIDRNAMFQEHKKWAQHFAPVSRQRTSHSNNPSPDRRLRIGYVSADYGTHSVTYFFESLLDAHDRSNFEIYGYGNVAKPDFVTERIKAKFDKYQNILGIDDESVANMIVHDKVDILVDIGGHTGRSRLSAFGYKPAPIQVTYLGYPDTTGMDAIDYRLTDVFANTPQSQQFYTEELVFLPQSFLCFTNNSDAPAIADSPVTKNGYITFGSFNNTCKINRPLLLLWSQILKANKNSRFLIKFMGGDDEGLREYYYRQFEELGIERKRLTIYGMLKKISEHLATYEEVDIALDTYPYNGTTTTFEALWMGVPVVSLVGESHMSRVGFSILSNIGLEFFAASTPEEYIAKAIALAAKPEALNKIRKSMRDRVINSPVYNKQLFANNIENAYREMWVKWCSRKNESSSVPDGIYQLDQDIQT